MWIDNLLDGATAPVERDVVWNGRTEKGYFRKISALQRLQLVKGQRVTAKNGQTEIELDLGAQESTKHQLVAYSLCDAEGKSVKTAREVGELPGSLVNVLFRIASEVNKDETEETLGKD